MCSARILSVMVVSPGASVSEDCVQLISVRVLFISRRITHREMDEGIASFRVSFASGAPVDEAMSAQDVVSNAEHRQCNGSKSVPSRRRHVSSLDQDDEFSELHFA